MLTRAHSDLWAAVREELRCKLGETCFRRWLEPLQLLSEKGEEIRLGVANGVVGSWVEKRYLPEILEAIREKAAGEVAVRLVLAPEVPAHRESPGAPEPPAAQRAPEGGASAPASAAARPSVAAAQPMEQRLDSFVVGGSNELAYSAALKILRLPGGAYNPLFVYGPSGVGKTHLLKGILHAFRARGAALRALYVTGEQFFHQYSMSVQDGTSRKFRERYRSLDVLIVDDVQLLVSKRKTQIEFLHTFTWLVESGRQIVLASDVPPKALTELDAGLVGRFLSGLVVGIGKPEFETRLGILRVHARRIPSRLDDSVLELVAGQVRANVRELIGALMRLDIQAQLRGGALTFQEAREVVAEIGAEACSRIDLRRIRDAVAAHFGLAPEVVVSSSRQRHVTLARQVAMYVARRCTKESLGAIGKYFGRRDHATVQCAAKKIALLVQEKETSVVLHVRAILDSLEA